MAKELYFPLESGGQYLSKKAKEIYFPLLTNGQYLSKKVIKAYCSVNGVSKLFWDGGGVAQNFMLHWETLVKKIIDGKKYTVVPNQKDVEIQKVNLGFTYFFIVPNDGDNYWVLTLSPASYGVTYYSVSTGENDPCYISTPITFNNDTWYVGYYTPFEYLYDPQYPTDYKPNCYYNNQAVLYEDYNTIATDYLLPLIYSSRYAEDYQVGQTYDLGYCDIEQTVRWAIGIFLYKNYADRGADYLYFLYHKDEVIDYILEATKNKTQINISIYRESSLYLTVNVLASSETNTHSIQVNGKQSSYGYEYLVPRYRPSFLPDRRIFVYVYRDQLQKSSTATSGSQSINNTGVQIATLNNTFSVYTSNIGINFDYQI